MKIRYSLALILSIVLLLLCLSATAATKEVEQDILYIGDFSYVYKEDGTIKIVQVLEGHQTDDAAYLVNFEEGAMNYIPSSINGQPVTEIGDYALRSLKIQAWTIPGTVKRIGTGAFYHSEVETVIMEEGVEELGDFVFENMNVTKIAIPSTVREMGVNPFCNCICYDGQPGIILSADNDYFSFVDGVLFENKGHRLVFYPFDREDTIYQIPDGTKMIGAYAFSGCQELDTIIIPDSITEIGKYAFTGCGFKTLELPGFLWSIEDGTFSYCGKTESIFIPSSVIFFGQDVFKDCEPECLIVEEGSRAEKYAIANGMKYRLIKKQEETNNGNAYTTENGPENHSWSGANNCVIDSWEDALNGIFRGIKLGDDYKDVEMPDNQQAFEIAEVVYTEYDWMKIKKDTLEVDDNGRIWCIHCFDFNFDGLCPGSRRFDVEDRFGDSEEDDDHTICYYGNQVTEDGGCACIDFVFDSSNQLVKVVLELGY